MERSEFDQFADEYLQTHKHSLAVTGEDPEYFHRYKIERLADYYLAHRLALPRRILDFGCGVGNSIPHLKTFFPDAIITGLDVSQRSLEVAESRFPGAADYELYDGKGPLGPEREFDLVFSACVFHHIDAEEHVSVFRKLRACVSADGAMATFEHNPLNPVTRHIVATCEFDANAVLLPAWKLAETQHRAGFERVNIAYVGFFPGALRRLRSMEPLLQRIPLGAQYFTIARP